MVDPSSLDALYLAYFTNDASRCREYGGGFTEFLRLGQVIRWHWPADVVEQWLYDHAGNESFLKDYELVDLTRISWRVGAVSLNLLMELSTGPSGADAIEYFAREPDHWGSVRQRGEPVDLAAMWDIHGSRKRWPLLLDRAV